MSGQRTYVQTVVPIQGAASACAEYLTVSTPSASYILASDANGEWVDVDTDTAGGDVTITVNTGMTVGSVNQFSKKGTGGNVVFAAGAGMTLRGSLTISDEDGVAALVVLTSTEAILMGNLA